MVVVVTSYNTFGLRRYNVSWFIDLRTLYTGKFEISFVILEKKNGYKENYDQK